MKRLTVILCLLLSALLLTGCASEHMPLDSETQTTEANYEAKILDFSDSVSAADLSIEYSLKDKTTYADRTVGEPIEIEFQGKKIKGTFSDSYYSTFDFSPNYAYEDENNKSFSVNAQDKLVMYSWDVSKNDGPTISEKVCIEKAKAFLSEEITDPTPYAVSVTTRDREQVYVVTFQKYAGEMKTTESIVVEITYTGELYSFYSYMLGQIPNDAKCDFDMTKVNETITKRLDSAFTKAKGIFDEVTYNFDEPMLTVLKDGRYAIYCWVTVECTEKLEAINEKGETISRLDTQRELVKFIVTK